MSNTMYTSIENLHNRSSWIPLIAKRFSDNWLAALHSMIWPSISRVGTNSSTCVVISPPYSPASYDDCDVKRICWPFLYHVIVESGLEESVLHVNVTLFTPLAQTLVFPVMFVNRGVTAQIKIVIMLSKQENAVAAVVAVAASLYFIC